MATTNFIPRDTVKFTCTFVTWAGSRSDTDEPPYFEVYSNKKLIYRLELTEEYHVSTGVYSVPYTIPNSPNLEFAFVGIVEGYSEVAVDTEHAVITTR